MRGVGAGWVIKRGAVRGHLRRVKVSPLSGSNAQLYQHQHRTARQEKENSLCVNETQEKITEKFTKQKNVKQLHVIQGVI